MSEYSGTQVHLVQLIISEPRTPNPELYLANLHTTVGHVQSVEQNPKRKVLWDAIAFRQIHGRLKGWLSQDDVALIWGWWAVPTLRQIEACGDLRGLI